MTILDPRLEDIKAFPRAMHFYVLTLHEIVLESKPERILEIGTQRGQSSMAMLTALGKLGKGKLVSLDHKDRSSILDGKYDDLKPYWQFIKGDTHLNETFEAAKNAIGEENMYDILFVDGDHSYAGAKQDVVEYSKLLRPGGILVMHDTVNRDAGVSQVWAELDWKEKFNFDWGLARGKANFVVGLGIAKKPLE